MQKILAKPLSYMSSFLACSIMALATGCASGGYKLTRQYARWINSQQLIVRVILYVLTSFVFMVTLLIDAVIYNTMDFWEGRVSAGNYQFKDGAKTYNVKHEVLPNQLKRSTIEILDGDRKQEVVLNETVTKEIEVFVDGHLRSVVRGISELPVASVYDVNGNLESQHMIFSVTSTASATSQNLMR